MTQIFLKQIFLTLELFNIHFNLKRLEEQNIKSCVVFTRVHIAWILILRVNHESAAVGWLLMVSLESRSILFARKSQLCPLRVKQPHHTGAALILYFMKTTAFHTKYLKQ